MRTFAVCGILGLLAFGYAGYQTGFIKLRTGSGKIISAVPVAEPELPRARFPHDLAPAARAKPVAEAADLKMPGDPVRLVILKADGALHPWHEKVPEEWLADSVEATHVVLILGGQKKTLLNAEKLADGSLSVTRFQYELEASIVEAKTGKVLAYRLFQNNPRSPLNEPIAFAAVFNWTTALARVGFANEAESGNHSTDVDD